MSRFEAFLVHLGISAALFAVLAALVVFVWYPGFFFEADGGWEGIRIILLVDLVAGPLLTLLVYKPEKPRLRADLSIIALFQIMCLAGGAWIVRDERPLALVYSDGTFFSMTANDFAEAGVGIDALDVIPGLSPKRIAVALPEDPDLEVEARREAMESDSPVRLLAKYYAPLALEMLHIDPEATPLTELEALDRLSNHLPAWLVRHGGRAADYAFFSFATRYRYAFLGVRRSDGEIVGLLQTQGQL